MEKPRMAPIAPGTAKNTPEFLLFQSGTFSGPSKRRYATARRLHPRSSEVGAACADAGFEKLECHRAPDGKTRRACHAPDDAIQGEPHHRVGLTPDWGFAPCAKGVIADAQQAGGRTDNFLVAVVRPLPARSLCIGRS